MRIFTQFDFSSCSADKKQLESLSVKQKPDSVEAGGVGGAGKNPGSNPSLTIGSLFEFEFMNYVHNFAVHRVRNSTFGTQTQSKLAVFGPFKVWALMNSNLNSKFQI